MGLGAIFDTFIEAAGNTDVGEMNRAINSNYDKIVSGAERRNKIRAQQEAHQAFLESNRSRNSSSSSNSGGGLGTLLFQAAVLGGIALLCNSDDKKENSK